MLKALQSTSTYRRAVVTGTKATHILGDQQQKAQFSVTSSKSQSLSIKDINQNFINLEYAVRGPLIMRALQLKAELQNGASKPFKSVITANIGDCHAMNQKPITFIRQVVACMADTKLLDSPDFPKDVKEKAREMLSYCNGQSIGSYTDSSGLEIVRRHIASYIQNRDNNIVDVDWRDVFTCAGATQGIKAILSLVNQSRKPGKPVGVMIPIPQYPLYSATLCEFGLHQINYYLDEERSWSLDIDELERAYKENADKSDIRAIAVINPGNPTGSVLTQENIVQILDFASRHNLLVMADEVYQHNVYDENAPFHSFKKTMFEKTNHRLELVSFMSVSKGYMGECGLRGGFCELTNFQDDVQAMLYKMLSSWLCPSVLAQAVIDCVVDPPKPGSDSYELHEQEKTNILTDLKHKAKFVIETFNSIEGIKCNHAAGAMYAYPKLALPEKAIQAARAQNQAPDYFYVLQFLENYGVSMVPGTGFGQLPGTYHFRTTILPPAEIFEDMMARFKDFHTKFLNQYS